MTPFLDSGSSQLNSIVVVFVGVARRFLTSPGTEEYREIKGKKMGEERGRQWGTASTKSDYK